MISVITCTRPQGVKYLYPLLEAINKTCTNAKRFLLCDNTTELYSEWTTESLILLEKMTPTDNKYIGWKALERASFFKEDLLFLEDDVFPTTAASVIDALNYIVPDSCGFSSLHRSRWTSVGIHNSNKFVMSQAVKIPLRSIAHLLAWRKLCTGDWEAIIGFDTALAIAGSNANWLYEQTERNYFNHIGEISAVHNGADGRSIAL